MQQLLKNGLIVLFSILLLSACGQKIKDANVIKVGTIDGPETALMEVAKQVAQKKYGLTIKIVTFTDYNLPQAAVDDGSIDANMTVHLPFLEAAIKARGYKIIPIGKTFVYPMGVYSQKIKSLDQLPAGASVAIPNDPSNEARALLLLAKAKLITLSDNNNVTATPRDIINNPKNLKFSEVDTAVVARTLPDVTIAVINTNYAIPAGLMPSKDAIYLESADSPYANIVVVRTSEKDKKQFHELIEALHSKEVLAIAKKLFKGQAIPAWKQDAISATK